jgi:hypothetical protein
MGAGKLREWERTLQFPMPIFRSRARAERGALLRREELPSVESVRTDIPADKSEGRSRPRTGVYITHDGQREQ